MYPTVVEIPRPSPGSPARAEAEAPQQTARETAIAHRPSAAEVREAPDARAPNLE